MIKINPQFERLKKERGEVKGTVHELFPHLYNERGERVEEIFIDIDEEHGDLIFESATMSAEDMERAAKMYIEKEKERCKTWLEKLTKRLAALEAVES